MLTCCELSVCATKLNVYGIVCGSTVITLTAGAGRCDGGVSLEQPAASATAQATATARDESSDLVIVLLDYAKLQPELGYAEGP